MLVDAAESQFVYQILNDDSHLNVYNMKKIRE